MFLLQEVNLEEESQAGRRVPRTRWPEVLHSIITSGFVMGDEERGSGAFGRFCFSKKNTKSSKPIVANGPTELPET